MIICSTFLIILFSFQVRKKSQDTSEQLNLNNLEKFKTANRQRSDILDLVTIIISINNINHNYHHINHNDHTRQVSSRVNCDVLVITGTKARMVEAGEAIHRYLYFSISLLVFIFQWRGHSQVFVFSQIFVFFNYCIGNN